MDYKITTEEIWGRISRGRKVKRLTVSKDDLSVSVINLGATVQQILYRGKDMILSFPTPELYEKFSIGCIGATVGRYAGRIAAGQFSIDGVDYQLTKNQNGNHLHGGQSGFQTKLWESCVIDDRIQFTLFSPDGEEGYPGNLNVRVTYRITEDNGLEIAFQAESDRDTVINLTNHCYFNPNGLDASFNKLTNPMNHDNRDVMLTVNADHVMELDGEIPTGQLLAVEGTRFDFRTPRILACDTDDLHGNYDHTFVLNPHGPEQPVAIAKGLKSGVRIEFLTDQPGVQLFTMGNPGTVFALEAQHFPDSPNHPEFPSTILRAGDVFSSRTVYRFSHE